MECIMQYGKDWDKSREESCVFAQNENIILCIPKSVLPPQSTENG